MSSPDIINVFKENRPNLSMASLRTYSSIVRNTSKQLDIAAEPKKIADSYKKVIELFMLFFPFQKFTSENSLSLISESVSIFQYLDEVGDHIVSNSLFTRKV